MVIQNKQFPKKEGINYFGGLSRKDFNIQSKPEYRPKKLEVIVHSAEEETVDVIDLGAPRRLRRAPPEPLPRPSARPPRRPYTPNPRLYPGPTAKPKRRPRRADGREARPARRHVFRRPVPNARLYRPAPRRLPPPASPPRRPWPPPAPPARALDTASRAALRLVASRRAPAPPAAPTSRAPSPAEPPAASRSRRLVVTLPAQVGMDAAARHSTSPDDCSDTDALSAPSEFLAEFLSAIMRRQYAEALKYCRLILQYEPHNATARGFYPLLRHKVQALKRNEGAGAAEAEGAAAGSRRGSSSEGSSSPAQRSPHARSLSHSHSSSNSRSHQCVSGSSGAAGSWARSGSEGSVASQSSLELDSSSASRSASASGGSSSPTPHDHNGNPQAPPDVHKRSDDLENDNDVSRLKSESSSTSLRRLRAQFACSIK